jgi:putative transposase
VAGSASLPRGLDQALRRPRTAWQETSPRPGTRGGWLFPAVLLDLYSRRIVGYATAPRPLRGLALQALAMAVAARKPKPRLLHHTDRGGQYLSAGTGAPQRARLARHLEPPEAGGLGEE